MTDGDQGPATSGNGRQRRGRDREPTALALAAGRTIAAAAAECGVAERSIRGWLRDQRFVTRVRQLRGELYARAVGRLVDLAGRAAETLGALLDAEAAATRLAAARAILALTPQAVQLVDVDERLAALEQAAEARERRSVV